MASKEHQQLAAFIKEVHQNLRSETRKYGAQKAWKLHCDHHEMLEKYAVAMKELATKYWDANASDENAKAKSRIEWVATRCLDYFKGGGMFKERLKEENKLSSGTQVSVQPDSKQQHGQIDSYFNVKSSFDSKFYLLDVGSCYNPFKTFSFFNVIPIDIAPASLDVHQCDFFNLKVSVAKERSGHTLQEGSVITELPEKSFDVVVFSLLLEYIPCSEHRYDFCQKAYSLLKPEGLLFIITPDSKNPSANAPLMRKWRISLSYLGYVQVFYEKLPHIHCMAYRKALYPAIAQRLWVLHAQKCTEAVCPKMLITIPQDFQNCRSSNKANISAGLPPVDRTDDENDTLMKMFLELPSI